MDALEQFERYTVADIEALPLQSFLPHNKRNRTGYHACLIIFYQLLRNLTRFEKCLYLQVDHTFDNSNNINVNIFALQNIDIDPFDDDSDDNNGEPDLLPEQEVELQMCYLSASTRKAAAIWNNYSSNVKRAWSTRATRMNALPVHGMYMNGIDIDNTEQFLTQTVYEDSIHLFCTIQSVVKKDHFTTHFCAVAMLDLVLT